jgi:hypothetical protein
MHMYICIDNDIYLIQTTGNTTKKTAFLDGIFGRMDLLKVADHFLGWMVVT